MADHSNLKGVKKRRAKKKPVKEEPKEQVPALDWFKTPSVCLLAGPPESGKSFALRYLLTKLCQEKRFHWGLCVCGSSDDGSYDYLPSGSVKRFTDQDTINKVIDIQRKERKPMFLVLDDVAGISFQQRCWSVLFSEYRHYQITIFVCVQYIHKVPPVVRECGTSAILFRMNIRRSLQAAWDSYGQDRPFNEFKQFLRELTNYEDYVGVLIFTQKRPEDKYKRFKAPVSETMPSIKF